MQAYILRAVRNCVFCRIKRVDSECDRDPRDLQVATCVPRRIKRVDSNFHQHEVYKIDRHRAITRKIALD